MEVPVLETDRLTLRGWTQDDRIPFARLNADPKVMEFMPSLLDRVGSDRLFDVIGANWQRGWGLWAVETRLESRFIGYVGFDQPSWTSHFTPCIEIGWRLDSWAWGRGFATEGARRVLEWANDNLPTPVHTIVSFTFEGNQRSRRVMEKLGMSTDPDDDFDHPKLPDHPLVRHVLYRFPSTTIDDREPRGGRASRYGSNVEGSPRGR